ncbi:MAG TPA: YihY/virulence factor BrkB family protein [Myxococcales bacterium]|jgi:membrane protein
MRVPGFEGVSPQLLWKRFLHALGDHAVLDGAATLAYYFLFSLFPLLFFLVLLTAYLPLRGALEEGLGRIRPLMPVSSMQLIEGQLRSLLEQQQPKLLTVSLLVALYSASRSLDFFRKSLNLAYHVSEARTYLRTQWLAVWTTVVTSTFVLGGLAMILLGGKGGLWLADRVGIERQFAFIWTWLRWPTTALVIMLGAALTYYWLPDVDQRFRYVSPGSVVSTLLWLLSTWGFSQYADNASSFNVTYGSLGGVIVLLTWLYLSSLVFMLGGELNAVIEHAAAGGKQPGAKQFGEPAHPTFDLREGYPAGVKRRQPSLWRSHVWHFVRPADRPDGRPDRR